MKHAALPNSYALKSLAKSIKLNHIPAPRGHR